MTARCALLAPSPDTATAQAVLDALHGDARWQLEVCAWHESPALPAQVLLLIVDGASLSATFARLGTLQREHPRAAVLAVVHGLDEAQLAGLLEAGVRDFVVMPFAASELQARLQHWVGAQPRPAAASAAQPCLREFIGQSPGFLRQVAKLPVYAACDAGVLIVGETGTGKEVCAQAVHYLSARAARPWVAVNCGAIPSELIEDELFGHVKGAYTTALAPRPGLVREAEGGTLFLDDIDCLPLAAQAKLLRFLQEREYRPVGSNAVQRADVRVISASNLQLPQLVACGRFRQDLYFRLNVLTVELPPLRERREDIRALALHFLRGFALQFERRLTGLTAQALQRLLAHDWPGNVRELQHVIERASVLAAGPLLTADDIEIDPHASGPQPMDSFQRAKAQVVQQFERRFIEQLLAAHGGNVTHAAQAAQKNRRAFFELMRKHRIEPQRFRGAAA